MTHVDPEFRAYCEESIFPDLDDLEQKRLAEVRSTCLVSLPIVLGLFVLVSCIFLPLNTAYTPAEVQYFLSDAEPALFQADTLMPWCTALQNVRFPLDAVGRKDEGRCLELLRRVGVGDFAGPAFHFGGIEQAVTAHPDVVIGLGQIGDEIPALVVGADDLDVADREFAGLRNDPDAPVRSGG